MCKGLAYLTLMIRTGRRREGDPIVGANERRRAIIEVLCQRKQDTMKNLANEFHVSLRTICYDIDELARNYPIVAIRGKYKGGVRIADGYRLDRKYLNHEQQRLLKRLSKTLSGEDRNIMESVAAGLFCRKMDGRFCRKKPDTDVRRAGRIDVAGVFCRTREGRGQSRSLH